MNDLQKRLLSMFDFFHNLCEEHSLVYSAAGGTLLGAVRHKGFIPWDDDIDVWMPRKDYEKLIDIFIHNRIINNYTLETPSFNGGMHYYTYGKLYDTNNLAIEKTKFNVKKGIYIDVFPIDGTGNTEKERNKIYYKMHIKNLFIASRVSVPRKQRSMYKNLIISLSNLIPESIISTKNLIYSFSNECKKYMFENSCYVGNLSGTNDVIKETVPRDWFDNLGLYDFEGIKIYGFKNYDEYLTNIYGDYNKLPPIGEKITTHDFDILDLNKSYL